MEDVLDLYEEAYDPRYPTICFDEKLITLHADVRAPQKSSPGQPERIDYEYERLGTANLFFMVEPLAGWRHVEMTERRAKLDCGVRGSGAPPDVQRDEPWSLTEGNRCLFLLKKVLHLNQENAHRLDIWSLKAVHAQRVANFSAVMQVVFNHMPDDPPTGVHVCLAVEFILEDNLQIGGGVAR